MSWYVYILRCADGTYYTGSTNDPQRRFLMHTQGKGAKYTRGRGPLEQVYLEICEDQSAACKRESQIKRLSREEKSKIIEQYKVERHDV